MKSPHPPIRAALAMTLALATMTAGPVTAAPRTKQASVEDAWLRLPAVPGRPAAAYFTLVGGDRPVRVTGVSSSLASRVELHSSSMSGGVMRMAPLAGVPLPSHARVAFHPGGSHAMLFGLNGTLKPGDRVPLRFSLEGGGTLTAQARVVAVGEGPGDMARHHH